MAFLKNAWYVAAWSAELEAGKLLARRLLDEPVVIYREPDGRARALTDRCAHRFAPLSLGRLVDGSVQCPYHGLRFNGAGACVHNPQGPVPRAARVRSFPLVERYGAIWIWMGDPDEADGAGIPEFDFLVPEHWYVGTGYMAIDGGYELEIDNILDLSHIEFLHPLFSSEAVSRGEIKCSQDGETVWSRRYIRDDTPPSFLYQAFNIATGTPVDRGLDVRWNAPASMALWTGGVASGHPPEEGVSVPSAHLFTPESSRRTHIFLCDQLSACARTGGRGHGPRERRAPAAAVRAGRPADHRGGGALHGRRRFLVAAPCVAERRRSSRARAANSREAHRFGEAQCAPRGRSRSGHAGLERMSTTVGNCANFRGTHRRP